MLVQMVVINQQKEPEKNMENIKSETSVLRIFLLCFMRSEAHTRSEKIKA